MSKTLLTILLTTLIIAPLSVGGTWWLLNRPDGLISPFVQRQDEPKPLLDLSIPRLSQRSFQASEIVVKEVLADEATFTSFLFTYQTLGKTMSGQLNVPKKPAPELTKAIIMLRGYIPAENYRTGDGTRRAAAIYADQGYVTIAPDFFGVGQSDDEPLDTWQGRFEKPVTVIELLETLKSQPISIPQLPNSSATTAGPLTFQPRVFGLWGHSNGGQIALATLEILSKPIPTTLWAPVTAPFPYSILAFGDENADEGKAGRAWVSEFEKTYDVFEFSLTRHLNRLTGPIQYHQGTADPDSLKRWADAFAAKVKTENLRRQNYQKFLSTASAEVVATAAATLPPIKLIYHVYPEADHNLQPGWNTVVQRDVEFFNQWLR